MSDQDNKSAATIATELFAIIVAYLYFAGWVYASDIFAEFGIALTAIDIPAYYFVVYAYAVFIPSAAGWFLLGALGITWWVLARVRLPRGAELAAIVLIAVVPLPVIRVLARSRAESDAAYIRSGHAKHVLLVARGDAAKHYSRNFLILAESGALRLIIKSEKRLFVFRQPQPDTQTLPAAYVYDLPTDDFASIVKASEAKENQ